MDETPLYFDMPRSHSFHKKGCWEVPVRSTGAEKRRLTIILACTAAGHMLPPIIIFKGKRVLKNLRIPPGVVVELQQKGWNDASLTLVWIQKVLLRYTKKQHALLVWDTFTGHMTEEVAESFRRATSQWQWFQGAAQAKSSRLIFAWTNHWSATVATSGPSTYRNKLLH